MTALSRQPSATINLKRCIAMAAVTAMCSFVAFAAGHTDQKEKNQGSEAGTYMAQAVGLCGAAIGTVFGGPIGGVTGYCSAIFSADMLEYLGWEVFDQRWRTAEWYNKADRYFPAKGQSEDYSEGLYFNDDGANDFHEDSRRATRAKFDFIFANLGLQATIDANLASGKVTKVLDAGCGNGAWMEFLREKGIFPVGLTLSGSQRQNILKKGFKEEQIFVLDYTQRFDAFVHEFNAVTALGSTEHLCSPIGRLSSINVAEENCRKTLAGTWGLFREYLKPRGRVFITSLTSNTKHSSANSDYVQNIDGYLLERAFGGYYPEFETILHGIRDAGFEPARSWDFTVHYHWASVLNLRPGGSWHVDWRQDTLEKLHRLVRDVVVDPHLVHFWAGYYRDSWLRHLGGKQNTPLTQEQAHNSPVHLKYVLFSQDQ